MKFLRVNMTTTAITVEDVPREYKGLGGRGLTSTMINNDVLPSCDPLGPDNKLIFAPGLLTGTKLVNTSRLSIGAKSPLTKGIKESNAGGTVGASLGNLGITAIIVEGQAREGEYYLLTIDAKGAVALESAHDYIGMRTYALVEKLLHVYDEKSSVLCIGPAGEFRMASASIQSSDADGRPCRAAGRGGLGAVMGAKGLKAIVVSSSGKDADALADADAFKTAAKAFATAVQADPFASQILPAMGTAALTSMVNGMGAFPSRNATQGVMENHEHIGGEKMVALINERGGKVGHRGCSQCIIRCSNEFVDQEGQYVTGSLEYETIWAMGGMTDIDDLDTIARLDFLADDIGLDTMNTGVAIGVAMDAGYKDFGDSRAAIEMMEEIAQGTALGKILGDGPEAVGKHFNHHRVPVVKGQSIAAYDPRGMQGNGVTYATSPMGADHTAGNLIGSYLTGVLNPLEAEGQVEASRKSQIFMAYLDCTGLCLFAAGAMANPEGAEALVKMINIKCGTQLGADEVVGMGVRTLTAEREFNAKAGLSKEDDRLARFFYEEPLPPHNKVFLISDEDLDSVHGMN
ncbi:MAG: aldehyde ferredoxin oxidoreductase C-terminal domain-containing protein [Desulfobacterales bacterium]|nr:aldehyde ferredoxin oxidoreductase C-terminal domain-containing protein [Desulfobacterales bacterium]MDX2510535.1 aldehyde ferredoxin oxidoreductase C-terminal domain-containing protein [Desulfobacterales bacterium]